MLDRILRAGSTDSSVGRDDDMVSLSVYFCAFCCLSTFFTIFCSSTRKARITLHGRVACTRDVSKSQEPTYIKSYVRTALSAYSRPRFCAVRAGILFPQGSLLSMAGVSVLRYFGHRGVYSARGSSSHMFKGIRQIRHLRQHPGDKGRSSRGARTCPNSRLPSAIRKPRDESTAGIADSADAGSETCTYLDRTALPESAPP